MRVRTGLMMAGVMVAGGMGGASVLGQTIPATPLKPPAQPTAVQPTSPNTTVDPGVKSGDVDLRAKFRAGQQTRYIFEQISKNSIKSLDGTGDMDQEQEQNERIGLALKVVDGNGDTGATIHVVYESIKVTLKTGNEVSEFDSTRPVPVKSKPVIRPANKLPPGVTPPQTATPLPPLPAEGMDPIKEMGDMDTSKMLGLVVGPMVGTTIIIKTDKNGKITSVSGGESLGGNIGGLGMLSGGGGLVPNPSQMASWLVTGLGGPSGNGYARVGQSWTNNDSMSGTPIGAFQMKTTHILKSASGGTANLAFSGKVEGPSEGTPTTSAGQVRSAGYNGTYVWDTRAGALADMATTMNVVLDGGVSTAKARMSSDTSVHIRRQ